MRKSRKPAQRVGVPVRRFKNDARLESGPAALAGHAEFGGEVRADMGDGRENQVAHETIPLTTWLMILPL